MDVFKRIVDSEPAEPRACGCVQPPLVGDQVAPYVAIENISVQKITPEYKIGMEPLVKMKTPPMKAAELWRDKPAVFLCLRRPGNSETFVFGYGAARSIAVDLALINCNICCNEEASTPQNLQTLLYF